MQCHLTVLSLFNADFDHICLFDELLMVAIDTLLSILLGLPRFLLLPIYWLSIVPIEYSMEYIKTPLAILQTERKISLVVKRHHKYGIFAIFSGYI